MEEIRMAIELRADEDRFGPGRLYGVLMKYNTKAQDRPELLSLAACPGRPRGSSSTDSISDPLLSPVWSLQSRATR